MQLLEISVSSILLIVIVVVIRSLSMYHVSKKVFVFLWSLILLRLLLPFTLPQGWGIFSRVQSTQTVSVPNIISVIHKGGQQVSAHFPISMDTIIVLYMIGVILVGGYFLTAYYRSYRFFAKADVVHSSYLTRWQQEHKLKRQIRIKEVTGIVSPLTYGIFQPVILLSKDFKISDERQLDYVLEHEYRHIKNFDTLKKLILILTLTIHWFNPFVWVLFFLFNQDIELACDEEVVKKFGKNKKSEYALMLLNIEEHSSLKITFHPSFNKNAIEERIVLIMKAKKNSIMIACFSTVLLLAAFIYISSPVAANARDDMEAKLGTKEVINEKDNSAVEVSETGIGDAVVIRKNGGACDILYATNKETGSKEQEKCKNRQEPYNTDSEVDITIH